MALNRYMHPRNIYKTPPNFKQLAIDYPEFRSFAKQDVSGRITIDFKNAEALRALTCTLLKKDFGLNIKIPLTRMIPTLPLRLNYILWVEDLLSISNCLDKVKGIDIGTGASCIYPLIICTTKGWHMLATDVDEESLNYAEQNVVENGLNNLITVKKVSGNTILREAVDGNESEFSFTMCNPPFFASVSELNSLHKARKIDRPRPRNAFCAGANEVVVEGGEVQFITKMIEESKELRQQIKIYTTMVGIKSNLPILKKLLRECSVNSFKETEFHQGHTTRWGLAWTFCNIDLRMISKTVVAEVKKTKPKPPLQYYISNASKLTDITEQLTYLFDKVFMTYEVIKKNRYLIMYCITANRNTWSHQRRKKREQERLNHVLSNIQEDLASTSEMISNLCVESPKAKRECTENNDQNVKKMKTNGDLFYEKCYLKSNLIIRKDCANFLLELFYIEGDGGKEALHQILHYIKNGLSFK